jgi:hypothetical protein
MFLHQRVQLENAVYLNNAECNIKPISANADLLNV